VDALVEPDALEIGMQYLSPNGMMLHCFQHGRAVEVRLVLALELHDGVLTAPAMDQMSKLFCIHLPGHGVLFAAVQDHRNLAALTQPVNCSFARAFISRTDSQFV
jgi:hypothetical protein